MSIDKEASEKIRELQILEKNLHALGMQKQAFQMEIAETSNALDELSKTNDEVYKIVGSIMLKSDKAKIIKELEEKKKLLEIRQSSIEKQESMIESKAQSVQEEAKKILEKKK